LVYFSLFPPYTIITALKTLVIQLYKHLLNQNNNNNNIDHVGVGGDGGGSGQMIPACSSAYFG
jgi:hypothetical protein